MKKKLKLLSQILYILVGVATLLKCINLKKNSDFLFSSVWKVIGRGIRSLKLLNDYSMKSGESCAVDVAKHMCFVKNLCLHWLLNNI